MDKKPFIRGSTPSGMSPLRDCLPPYRPGMVKSWLERHFSDPGRVLLPFGNSPQIALEAARAGYQAILPVHNPVLRFATERLADPPSEEALKSALAKLGSSYKGKDRLKPLILSLYITDCPQCGESTPAVSFIWSRQAREPVEKICRCAECGESSRAPVESSDIQKALKYQENSPVYARALTRVAAPADPIRSKVETVLSSYPPRTVYALFSVLNKLTGSNLPPEDTHLLEMLLLHAFYSSSPIRSTGEEAERSADLFQEENIWFKLEEAVHAWAGNAPAVEVTTWPALPAAGGVILYPGRVRELVAELEGTDLQALVLIFPKPTPTFWALSALWTGWLWGQDAAAPLRGILSVTNFDWPWMTRAVDLTLSGFYQLLPSGTRCFGLLPNPNRDYLISAVSAARSAGFELENISLDPDLLFGETTWASRKGIFTAKTTPDIRPLIRQAGFDLLKRSGEPRDAQSLAAAGLFRIAEVGFPPSALQAEVYFPQLQKDFEDNLAFRQGFLGFNDGKLWWHQELENSPSPLSDRVERAVVELLINTQNPLSEDEVCRTLYQEFRGVFTPRDGLIQACLKSYAIQTPDHSGLWVLKPGEQPARRREDLIQIKSIFQQIGSSLGYDISEEKTSSAVGHIQWKKPGDPGFSFLISASGLLGKILHEHQGDQETRWLIMPGSRAGLVYYKLENNPPLADLVRINWGLAKFRQVRRLAEAGGLTVHTFLEGLKLDPFQSDSPQLTLI